MKENTIISYSFDELTKEAQAVAIEQRRNSDDSIDYDFESRFIIDDFEFNANEAGFKNAKVQYSGFGSQGDGASFTCDSVNLLEFIDEYASETERESYQPLLDYIIENDIAQSSIYLQRVNHHYSHENTVTTESELLDFTPETSSDMQDYLGKIQDDLANHVEQVRLNICKQLYKNLRDAFDNVNSDDYIAENYRANDYQFTSDGKMFKY